MSYSACPCCKTAIYAYVDGGWTERICWKCGYYDSDIPAFIECPHLFHDIVRKNANYYLVKYARYGRRKKGS
jgi:hypothetical protein